MMKNEDEEIEKAVQKIQLIYKNAEKDSNADSKNILNMMIDNVSELREYYVISKQQARRAFSAALLSCIFGFLIYMFGILATIFFDANVSVISIVGGTTVELISALFFGLYRESTKQLSVYHQRLGSTEKYLTAIQIIKNLPQDKQCEQYSNLIEHILLDNQELVRHNYGEKDI